MWGILAILRTEERSGQDGDEDDEVLEHRKQYPDQIGRAHV